MHDISLVDPDLLAHLASDVAEALNLVKALHLAAAIAQHARDLAVLLPVFLELQLLLYLLSTAFRTLGFVPTKLVLRHGVRDGKDLCLLLTGPEVASERVRL